MMVRNKRFDKTVRPEVVAGQFYPAGQDELASLVNNLSVKTTDASTVVKPRILIVPHAGYVYSGQVAATAFKTLVPNSYRRVIILGVSHNFPFAGVAASGEDKWQTPLGQVAVDREFIDRLIEAQTGVFVDSNIHAPEHSLEVQLPFLQTVLSDFKIVPLLLGGDDLDDINNIAGALNDLMDSETLLVISSDLSHYPPYQVAKQVDTRLLDSIVTGDLNNFIDTYESLEKETHDGVQTYACGHAAISVGLKLAELRDFNGELLMYANSGDVDIGDKSQVVGYGAVMFSENKRDLNKPEQQLTLRLARDVLQEYYFNKASKIDLSPYPIFKNARGVFVTLRRRQDNELRGCIGQVLPTGSLEQNIKDMTSAAATQDARFGSVTADELAEIEIEVSVLSPLESVSQVEEIELGRHGVMVKQGVKTGVFLPQVALETGWDLATFMSRLCQDKAGIAANAWQTGEAEIYKFSAQVFSE